MLSPPIAQRPVGTLKVGHLRLHPIPAESETQRYILRTCVFHEIMTYAKDGGL